MKHQTLLLLSTLFIALTCSAKVKLPNLFSDHMVLQRNSNVQLWGSSSANSTVSIKASWSNQTYTTKSDSQGKWKTSIPSIDAGGPYTISFYDDNTAPTVLKDILLGDIWVCSGQSNMGFTMEGNIGQHNANSQDYIVFAEETTPIRMFDVENTSNRALQEDVVGTWKTHTPANVAKCSAVAYYFAHNLQRKLHVPIGLLVTAWGGSSQEAWVKRSICEQFPSIDITHLDDDAKVQPNTYPTLLYNAMLYPVTPITIKGVIWYQGENNRDRYKEYYKLFPAFIQQLRDDFRQPNLPFYYAQIAPYRKRKIEGDNVLFREAQALCTKDIKHVGMTCTVDLGDSIFIHPPKKEDVGKRLAYWALADTYGITGFNHRSPEFDYADFESGKAIVNFKYDAGYSVHFKNHKGDNTLFEVAGKDKVFHPAQVKFINKRKQLQVWSPKVPKPIAVRYAFHDLDIGNLYGNNGLPVPAFRSDNW